MPRKYSVRSVRASRGLSARYRRAVDREYELRVALSRLLGVVGGSDLPSNLPSVKHARELLERAPEGSYEA